MADLQGSFSSCGNVFEIVVKDWRQASRSDLVQRLVPSWQFVNVGFVPG